jgi:2-polyprenyl-3-methyl-5-hydroxy-6-metoxy-1,4-benzoquinol methylase
MLCASYTDPRLSAVYDVLNGPGPDSAFYIDLAGEAPKSILDVGCGTGSLACDLAARGHNATGADPAAAMLDIARSRSGDDKVTWLNVAAADLSIETRFDLIILTGHVFQVFLTDQDVSRVLHVLRRHLAPGGRLAFETRNPTVRKWEEWTPAKTSKRVEVPGLGPVEAHHEIRSVIGSLVSYETHFRFGGTDVVTSDTLRFMHRDELATFLANAGFVDFTWYGDWDRSALGPTSPEIIVVAG